jgi:uncharacterized protein (DUF1330 family)
MVTCYLRYTIDPHKVAEFEKYARMVIPLAAAFGGVHHGYFLPHEGANNIAVALFSFPSLAEYERYRGALREDQRAVAARRFAEDTRCIISFERSFMRPVFA